MSLREQHLRFEYCDRWLFVLVSWLIILHRHSPERDNRFAARAIEFLVDMFNDEIEIVRVNSIVSVRKMCETGWVDLREEQLHVVLAVLGMVCFSFDSQ